MYYMRLYPKAKVYSRCKNRYMSWILYTSELISITERKVSGHYDWSTIRDEQIKQKNQAS